MATKTDLGTAQHTFVVSCLTSLVGKSDNYAYGCGCDRSKYGGDESVAPYTPANGVEADATSACPKAAADLCS